VYTSSMDDWEYNSKIISILNKYTKVI
jgi:hypothetical protein